jgi:conjugative relaxase-like TrwC/TraI family protein
LRGPTWLTRPGYDLTLSAPKSVSLLWGLGDDRVAAVVREAYDEAVDAAMGYLDREGCMVRRGRGGRVRFDGDGLIAAAFRHRTSREGDAQLYTHVLVANMTRGPDGEWSSPFGRELFGHARAAGCIYQGVLRRRLIERLGVRFGPVTKGYAEVVGIDRDARRAFSRRRVAIERAMVEHGARSKRGAQIATLDTRPDKPEAMTEEALRAAWAERADEIGLDVRKALGRPGPVPGEVGNRRAPGDGAHRAGRELPAPPRRGSGGGVVTERAPARRGPRPRRRVPGGGAGHRAADGTVDDPGDARHRGRGPRPGPAAAPGAGTLGRAGCRCHRREAVAQSPSG